MLKFKNLSNLGAILSFTMQAQICSALLFVTSLRSSWLCVIAQNRVFVWQFATSRLKTRVVSPDQKSRNADTSTSRYIENMVKRCAWGTCRNDSRFPHLQNKNKNGDPLKFFRFPAPKRWKEAAERRKRWIVACHRGDGFECKKDSYICSLHFVGENGPTSEHPDPISAITSKEKVC